jgi:secretion/DNA translocation related CpaE-like protein
MPAPQTVEERARWKPAEATEAVLIGGTDRLRDEVARIAAAAGLGLRADPPTGAPAPVAGASPVLLGTAGYSRPPRTESEVIVVGFADEAAALWDLAAAAGAGRVAVLPDGAAWLAEYLSRARRRKTAGKMVAVRSASGGVGASALSGWLAAAAARSGTATVLVDGDPLGGGLASALGAADIPGLVWPDLAEVRGSVNPVQLAASLPVAGGFSLLSWPAVGDEVLHGMPESVVATEVISAATGAFGLVLVDAGRLRVEPDLGAVADDIVLVVRADAHSQRAAASAVAATAGTGARLHLVVRGPLPAGVDEQLVSERLGVPLAGYLPHLRTAHAAQRDGRLLDLVSARRVRKLCAGLLDRLAPAQLPGERP